MFVCWQIVFPIVHVYACAAHTLPRTDTRERAKSRKQANMTWLWSLTFFAFFSSLLILKCIGLSCFEWLPVTNLDVSRYWQAMAVSTDGSKIVIGPERDYLY